VNRSIEETVCNARLDALDIVFVHDLSPDNPFWVVLEEQFEIAPQGRGPLRATRIARKGSAMLGPWREQAGTDHEIY